MGWDRNEGGESPFRLLTAVSKTREGMKLAAPGTFSRRNEFILLAGRRGRFLSRTPIASSEIAQEQTVWISGTLSALPEFSLH